MSEIKWEDVAHLYIGCEVFVFTDEAITDGFLKKYLKDYPSGVYNPIMTIDKFKHFIYSGYKPILRPMSDMTEEERGWYLIINNANHSKEQCDANNTAWLLQKHFDLFDLIKSGQAIDKTTIKP